MTRAGGVDGPATGALLRAGRFVTRWEESDDGRAVLRELLFTVVGVRRRPGGMTGHAGPS